MYKSTYLKHLNDWRKKARLLMLLALPLFFIPNTIHAQVTPGTQADQGSPERTKPAKMEEYIVKAIEEHYRAGFPENVRADKDLADSLLSITYYKRTDSEVEDKILLTVHIPRYQKNYLAGDIDGDGNDEIIASVSTEGGGTGSNKWWNDLFVFKLVENKFALMLIKKSTEVCGCKSDNAVSGLFYPSAIDKGMITGYSLCWGELDIPCCPSLRYETRIKYAGGKLVFVSKKPARKDQDD